jgi:hypothetical protein
MACRIPSFLLLSSSLALAVCTTLTAQSDQGAQSNPVKVVPAPVGLEETPGVHVKTAPAPGFVPSSVPFGIESRSAKSPSIRVLSEDQISRTDRDLIADAESSIQERAGFENLDFNGRGWTYHQLDCPALPNHLFLRFTRNDGTRDMSMFSAVIPRNGDGRVHIIPIVRRGYSLFSPAPIAALTIAAFNHIRSEEQSGTSSDWLGTGLCYAALAGANPQVEVLKPDPAENPEIPATFPPTLVVTTDGGAIIRFADISAVPHPMEWNMIFDRKGKLLKATHFPAYVTDRGRRTPSPLPLSNTTSSVAQP